jgi:flagellar biosynthetic protein FliO
MSDYGLLIQSMVFLIFIVVLAYLAVRYGLRSVYRGMNSGHMKVIERVPLDPKSGSALLLVQIGKDVYLVGSAQGGVRLLKTFDWKELEISTEDDQAKPLNLKDSFVNILERFRKESGSEDDSVSGGSR